MLHTYRILMLLAAAALAPLSFAAEAPAWHGEFAGAMHTAWKTGEPMPQISRAHPEAALADGYAVQRLFVEQMLAGGEIGGFKAAIVGAESQAGMGLDGPLTGRSVRRRHPLRKRQHRHRSGGGPAPHV